MIYEKRGFKVSEVSKLKAKAKARAESKSKSKSKSTTPLKPKEGLNGPPLPKEGLNGDPRAAPTSAKGGQIWGTERYCVLFDQSLIR
jgi:hypothetical protein